LISAISGFAAGLAAWTLLEYAIHYWLGHLPKGRTLISSEHLKHHADILYFTPIPLKIRGAVPVLTVLLVGVGLAFGLPAGAAFTAAVAVGWTAYEWLHQSIHVDGPRGAYSRWASRHHLYHHFVHPGKNHGVTTPLWDFVFRTHVPAARVRVPARGIASIPWLDAARRSDSPPSRFAADYDVV